MRSAAKTQMVERDRALPGRAQYEFEVPDTHVVLGTSLQGPWPESSARAIFAMGCFWGAERLFWQIPGVITTAAGYTAGFTPHPTYEEVCSAWTGHTEAVLVVYDPARVQYSDLLKAFWENHDPTQGMRQGGDIGTQYRSGIYVFDEAQREAALESRDTYQRSLSSNGFGEITTEILDASEFFYAEPYHQQYLHKNPGGYCNHGFCQVAYPS
jgi:peptide-methionine (S)-S-oxide reductase